MTFYCSYDDAFTNEDFSSGTHIDYSKVTYPQGFLILFVIDFVCFVLYG